MKQFSMSSADQLGVCEIEFGGEWLVLQPERAAWWAKERTLFVADLHLGKDATFRAAGIPLPHAFADDLERLARLVDRLKTQRIIVLGDLLHARRGRCESMIDAFAAWRTLRSQIELLLVRGNHDRHAGDPPPSWQIKCLSGPTRLGPWALVHVPTFKESLPTLAGHLHPKYRLLRGADHLRLPCFLRRGQTFVLPAFAEFVDHGFVVPRPGDGIFVVAESDVIQIHSQA